MLLYVIAIVTMLASWLVSARLKSKFSQYSQIPLQSGVSGQEAALQMLRGNGIYDVKIISVEGKLTDHYNPVNKTVNLSHDVYYGRNAAAVAVATHECGHAVQHATAYSMLKFRSALVPVQSVSARILNVIMLVLVFGGVLAGGTGMLPYVLLIIIGCNLVLTLFALITLPVEFDASRRALAWTEKSGIVTTKEHEMAKDALWWAAMTYVVAAAGAMAQLLYFLSIFMGRRND